MNREELDEIKRQFDSCAERLASQIDALAEQVAVITRKIDQLASVMRGGLREALTDAALTLKDPT